LKHAGARNKRGGVSARERGSEPIPPAADSIVRSAGAFVFRGAAFFWFFSWPFKKRTPPRWLPLQNQCAEGTKKVFLTLVSAHGVTPVLKYGDWRLKAMFVSREGHAFHCFHIGLYCGLNAVAAGHKVFHKAGFFAWVNGQHIV
jgi:hypothetical protein